MTDICLHQAGRFDDAIDIFKKILKGLEMRHGNKPHHLIGTTLHNIGILLLWKGQYKEAWENFNQASSVRMESLSRNHPDIAVRCKCMCATNLCIIGAQNSWKQTITRIGVAI